MRLEKLTDMTTFLNAISASLDDWALDDASDIVDIETFNDTVVVTFGDEALFYAVINDTKYMPAFDFNVNSLKKTITKYL